MLLQSLLKLLYLSVFGLQWVNVLWGLYRSLEFLIFNDLSKMSEFLVVWVLTEPRLSQTGLGF